MKKSQIDILQQAIKKYGSFPQCDQFIEEAAECIQAINKLKRIGGISFEGIITPNPGTDLKYSELYFGLCSEIADLKIMIAQMELMLNKEAIDLSVDRKIERLAQRMNYEPKWHYDIHIHKGNNNLFPGWTAGFHQLPHHFWIAVNTSNVPDGFWYSNRKGQKFLVKLATNSELYGIEGFSNKDARECVIVVGDEDCKGNVLLMSHIAFVLDQEIKD